MKQAFSPKSNRGVALVLVMLAVLLLSVICLGMMYSTNTETSINSNFKQSQLAIYAALAGLQEARDRLEPAVPTITPPTGLPLTGTTNLIYLINPKSGETVAPWSTSNAYFDTELCQEGLLGLSGTRGVPCTTIPATSSPSWYSTVDDSQVSNAPWNLTNPLDLKWTRVTLKGDSMTPYPVDGNSANATQVCWDGYHQVAIPAGYGANCMPNGSVVTLTLKSAGSGYTSAPTVTIAVPGSGTQATATATAASISNGQVSSVTVTSPGSSYTSAPTVAFSGGGGTGASATATVVALGQPVTSVTLSSAGGQCYGTAPAVSVTGGGGSGAAATAVLAGAKSCINSWSPSAHCASLKNTTVTGVTLSGGGGTGFTGTVTFDSSGHVSSSSIQTIGSSFTSSPTTAGGGSPSLSGCTVTPNATAGYVVSSLTLGAGGGGYTSAPTLSIGTGVGSGAVPSGTAALGAVAGNAGQVISINVTSGGSGYTSVPTVTLTGGGGAGTVGTAVLGSTFTITGLTLNNAGLGYTSDPAVTISGGGGSGATATATIGRGTDYGVVYLITSFAQTRTGARAMAQMEAASPVLGYASTGALTLDGPSPSLGALPNSNNFVVQGNDANSCGEIAEPNHPAIDTYDDPNASPATDSTTTVINALPRPGNITGAGGTPSVQNGFDSLGDTMGTPTGLKAMIDAIHAAPGANIYGDSPGSIAYGTVGSPVVDYVGGSLSLGGASGGYGILVVTGTLSMSGNFSWHGLVLVIGDGVANFSGGGNGSIVGSMVVANIWDNHTSQDLLSSLGSPSISWNGGGGNGITYDHCWATDLMSKIPFTPPPSTKPLKVLSVRALP